MATIVQFPRPNKASKLKTKPYDRLSAVMDELAQKIRPDENDLVNRLEKAIIRLEKLMQGSC